MLLIAVVENKVLSFKSDRLLACDFIVAADDAVFVTPCVRLVVASKK
jgi:enoyl-CoA hydratase/carnithine racemase